MNEFAPDWSTESAPAAPAPTAPPAPPAPLAPAGFAMPADPAAALDVAAPLQMQAPAAAAPAAAPPAPLAPPAPFGAEAPGAGIPAAPAHPAAPVEQVMPSAMSFAELAAAPPALAGAHPAHPDSLAMPQAHGAPSHAMPAGFDQAPAAIGGVAAASPADLADRDGALALAAPAAGRANPADIPSWAQPSLALVVGIFALVWQLAAYYAREILPLALANPAFTKARFDDFVQNVPTAGSSIGGFVGMGLGLTTLVLLYLGIRAGVREPVLQGAIGLFGGIALAATVLLPILL